MPEVWRFWLTNPKKIQLRNAKFQSENRGYLRLWRVSNPGKVLLYRHLRRVRVRAVVVEHGLTRDEWLEILEVFGHCCAYCLRSDLKLTVDHVVPVSRGGDHTAENVVPACIGCNSRKNDRLIFSMAAAA